MRDLSIEIKVGTVVIAAIIILLYGIIWVKEYKFNVDHFRYSCMFPEVGTLAIGDPVGVLGVEKGEVKDIKLKGDNVLVTISLDKEVALKEDARFAIKNVGLMGERYVAIWPGESENALDLNIPRMGEYDTGIPEVMGMMGDAIEEVRDLVGQLEGTFGKSGKAQEIRQIIDALHEITENTNRFIVDNQNTMEKTLTSISDAAGRMDSFLDSNTVDMQKAVSNFAEASVKLNELSDDIKDITKRIKKGEGTLGKTMADDSLYHDLRQAMNNLDSLITDFKEHPKKYIHLSIF